MALSGSVTSTNGYTDQYGKRTLTFSWTATQSIENNTSTISWTLSTSGGYPYWIYYSKTKVVIDGATVYYVEGKQQIAPGTITTGTVTLTHNSVGDRSFTASVQAGIYEHAVNCTATGTWTLNNIPRASSVTATGLVFGTQGTLSITRADNSFKDGIHWAFGSQVGSIVADEDPTSAATVTWTPPASLMNEIPNSTSGEVQIIAHTFNSGGTLIATKTSIVSVSVPDDVNTKPTVSGTLTNTNTTFGGYTQGLSAVGVASSATGKYSATIVGYSVTFEGNTYSGQNVTTNVISGSGNLTLKVKATDSRGLSNEQSYTVAAAAYSTPTMEYSVHRCDSGGTADDMGAYAKVWIRATCSDVVYGGNHRNSVTPALQMRQAGASTWTTVTIGGSTTYSSNNTVAETNIVVAADDTKSWEFKASVSDLVNTITQTIQISVGYATIDFFKGGRGIAFGTTANSTGFKCAMDADFTGDVIISGMRIAAGTKTFQATASQDNQLFSYADLNTLFGTNDCGSTNVVVLASNGDISADTSGGNKIIDGTYNDSSGVNIHSTVAFSGVTIRVNYIAIHF